jgi:glycosyltransferase involved in cell wall biosynthesis
VSEHAADVQNAARASPSPEHAVSVKPGRAGEPGSFPALSVIVLDEGLSPDARDRTLTSLVRQTVATTVVHELSGASGTSTSYVVLVVAGTVLDVTACERAVWFLTTHPGFTCVTGGTAAADPSTTPLSCAQQFLVARADAAERVLAATKSTNRALAIALAIGLFRESGRGAGWVSQPLILESAAADALAAITADALLSMRTLGLDAAAVVDVHSNPIPSVPLQQLAQWVPPAVQVRRIPATGLRILLLVQGFPMGGYTAVNVDLVPRLAAAGHVITSCSTEIWRSDWRLEEIRAVAPDIHHPHAMVPADAVPGYIDWLIATRGIDVVLTSHSHLAYHLLPYLRLRHPAVAFVDWVHTDWFEAGMYGSYATMASQWSGELDAQLTTSEALRQQLIGAGCAAEAVAVAYIGIDAARWSHGDVRHPEIRASIGATDSTLVMLFCGRLSAEKRPHLAVDVLAGLCADGRDVQLLLAGDGPLARDVQLRAQALGVGDRCKLLGVLDEFTLRHVYAASDVLLAPSAIEGISRSVFEAMSMGCVPVVSDVGGQRELVVPGTGSLVAADGDSADRYLHATRTWCDPAARAAAAAAARALIVDRFDSSETVRQITAALERARNRRRTRPAGVSSALAEGVAVLSLELTRRHVLRTLGG